MKKSLLLLISLLSLSLGACDSPVPEGSQPTSVNEQIYQIYQLYLSNGGTQTYDEWLASIKGEKGDKGDTGEQGPKGDDGVAGKSAYEIFMYYHPDYNGTEEDWINDVALGNKCSLFGHSFGEAAVTKEAKVGIDGEKTYICTACGYERHEIIPQLVPAEAEFYGEDNQYVNYGSYPQTHVSDPTIINNLNQLTETNDKGYYVLNGKQYAKITANPAKTGTYVNDYGNSQVFLYSDGSPMVKGQTEYFAVEPIKWKVLSGNKIITDIVLDVCCFNKTTYNSKDDDGNTIFANDYNYSYLREYLNTDFYTSAFSDTQAASLMDVYQNDKVYILSSGEIGQYHLSFSIASDYAYAKGLNFALNEEHFKNVYYWTSTQIDRSGADYYVYCVEQQWVCASLCIVSSLFGIRPAIELVID